MCGRATLICSLHRHFSIVYRFIVRLSKIKNMNISFVLAFLQAFRFFFFSWFTSKIIMILILFQSLNFRISIKLYSIWYVNVCSLFIGMQTFCFSENNCMFHEYMTSRWKVGKIRRRRWWWKKHQRHNQHKRQINERSEPDNCVYSSKSVQMPLLKCNF